MNGADELDEGTAMAKLASHPLLPLRDSYPTLPKHAPLMMPLLLLPPNAIMTTTKATISQLTTTSMMTTTTTMCG